MNYIREIHNTGTYQELRTLAKTEVDDKIAELEERILRLRHFRKLSPTITDFPSFEDACCTSAVYDEDAEFEVWREIYDNWPGVSQGPGAGYW